LAGIDNLQGEGDYDFDEDGNVKWLWNVGAQVDPNEIRDESEDHLEVGVEDPREKIRHGPNGYSPHEWEAQSKSGKVSWRRRWRHGTLYDQGMVQCPICHVFFWPDRQHRVYNTDECKEEGGKEKERLKKRRQRMKKIIKGRVLPLILGRLTYRFTSFVPINATL